MNKIPMQLLVDSICFLELSSDKVIDPDSAIAQLEGIAGVLQRLSLQEREEFFLYIKERVLTTVHAEEKELLSSLPENLGLLPSEEKEF